MHTVLGNTLSDTRVLSTDGQELGTLQNITFEPTNGQLAELVVDTDVQQLFGQAQDEDGHIRLPANLIESLQDHLVIRPPEGHI